MTPWLPDVLGKDFEQLTLELSAGSPATLVRYTSTSAQRGPSSLTGADVLYVHGFSDYFFQRELAEFWHRAGAHFYALDLHNYGRSLRPGQVPGHVSSLTEYDDDIAAALTAMGRTVAGREVGHELEEEISERTPAGRAGITTEGTPGTTPGTEPATTPGAMPGWATAWAAHAPEFVAEWVAEALAALAKRRAIPVETNRRPLVLVGHSTGGLTLSLWAARHPGVADALVLNSPWLEFQASELGRAMMAPLIHARLRFRPEAPYPGIDPGFYTRAVSSRFDGEWDYKQKWRPDRGFPVTAAFLNAVFRGQSTVAHGLGIDSPVLVMLSDKSYLEPKWSGDALAADVVLNVDSVARRAVDLGPDVTLHRIAGAFHDVFLSPAAIRANAYAGMGRWTEAALDCAAATRWANEQ